MLQPDHTVIGTKACAAKTNFQLSGVNWSFTSGLYVSYLSSINVLFFPSALLYNWIFIHPFSLQPQAPFERVPRVRSAFICFYDAPKTSYLLQIKINFFPFFCTKYR